MEVKICAFIHTHPGMMQIEVHNMKTTRAGKPFPTALLPLHDTRRVSPPEDLAQNHTACISSQYILNQNKPFWLKGVVIR